MRNAVLGFLAIFCAIPILCHGQDQTADTSPGLIANFPNKLFNKIGNQSATLQHRLERQTERYLMRMARKEEKLRASLYKTDSAKATALYPQDPRQQYVMMLQKFRQD